METKTNIVELLKDSPKGMELYSPMFGKIYLEGVKDTGHAILIKVSTSCNSIHQFYPDGKYNTYYSESECLLFPSKDQRDWSKFQRPFKDGDILATDLGSVFFLNTRLNSDEHYGCYVGIGGDGSFHICAPFAYKECCSLATKKEKKKLFDAIKANGYKWNAETKTLEELIKPKFKVGDKVRHKTTNKDDVYEISKVYDDSYGLVDFTWMIYMKYQDQYELVPNKLDINTLIPFESRVLVRNFNDEEWCPAIWGVYGYGKEYPHIVVSGNNFIQCIPYEKNEHLLGTTNDCDDYYKTWK